MDAAKEGVEPRATERTEGMTYCLKRECPSALVKSFSIFAGSNRGTSDMRSSTMSCDRGRSEPIGREIARYIMNDSVGLKMTTQGMTRLILLKPNKH